MNNQTNTNLSTSTVTSLLTDAFERPGLDSRATPGAIAAALESAGWVCTVERADDDSWSAVKAHRGDESAYIAFEESRDYALAYDSDAKISRIYDTWDLVDLQLV